MTLHGNMWWVGYYDFYLGNKVLLNLKMYSFKTENQE